MLFFLMLCGLNVTCNDIMFLHMCCELGLKLHRSLRLYIENYHGADDGAEKPQKRTQDMSRWMQSDSFHVQQTSQTNVCNPAVRLESMTSGFWLSCWIICSCDDEEENKSQHLSSLSVSARCDKSVATLSAYFKAFRVSLFRLLRPIVVLLVIGHWYKIQFLLPIKETHDSISVHNSDWLWYLLPHTCISTGVISFVWMSAATSATFCLLL